MSVRSKYRKRFHMGDVLIREGDEGAELYVLEEGKLNVFIQGRQVGVIDAGRSQEFVGEVSPLLGAPRTATVVAASDCLVLVIPGVELDEVLTKVPSLGAKLARSLCKKLMLSSQAHVHLQATENSILSSENTALSLRNYMQGVMSLMDQAAADKSGQATQLMCDYFRTTNPWGIQKGDVTKLLSMS